MKMTAVIDFITSEMETFSRFSAITKVLVVSRRATNWYVFLLTYLLYCYRDFQETAEKGKSRGATVSL